MTEYRKGDVCSLEVVVDEVPNENGVCQVIYVGDAGEGWCAYPNVKDLTLIRRAPVDLATCELPVEVNHPLYHGQTVLLIHRYEGVGFAKADKHFLTDDLAQFRPLDAPAPESEVERLRAQRDMLSLRRWA